MKSIMFDAGPIISLTTNNLLWTLGALKQKFKGSFCLAQAVKKELVDRPFVTKKFKFEAIQVQQQIDAKVLTVLKDDTVRVEGERLQAWANNIFVANGHAIAIVQSGEMQSLAATTLFEADAFATDERITRMLLEDPVALCELLERRLHTRIKMNQAIVDAFEEATRYVHVIRSVELVTIAFERGLLDKFVVNLPQSRKELLESVLWGVKLNGCAVTEQEINQILKIELRNK